MATMRSAVVLGLVAASSALAPGAHRNTLAFAGPALPLVQSHILSSQRLPALRQPRAASLKVTTVSLHKQFHGKMEPGHRVPRCTMSSRVFMCGPCVAGLLLARGFFVFDLGCLQMVDAVLVQGALAAAAGLGVAVGGIYFIETKAAKENLTDKQYNEFAMDGSDAENKFSGSDQTLDDLINAMEVAQVNPEQLIHSFVYFGFCGQFIIYSCPTNSIYECM